MTENECGEILMRISIGRLACSHHDQPYIVPIYFAYEPELLYGFTTAGQKIEWMRANPKVCVEIDEITNHFQWTSVVLRGRYRELPDLPSFAEERDHAWKLLRQCRCFCQLRFLKTWSSR
jgi:nitroimidazol reductase NimA-like FMN-containing flavoprotein (pyridoxamine 5'-phosphate oxidase superfamily)